MSRNGLPTGACTGFSVILPPRAWRRASSALVKLKDIEAGYRDPGMILMSMNGLPPQQIFHDNRP